jgi:uncharacterized protein
MDHKHQPLTAVAAALLLMLVAALENTVAPWAPFYVVYAALATALPFLIGAVDNAAFRRPSVRYLLVGLAGAVILHGLFSVMTARADLPGMFGRVLTVAAARLATRPEAVGQWYVLFIQVWAGFGEEVFYRGTLQRSLRSRFGPLASIVAASLLFAVRHYTQVLLGWPEVDWTSATIWVAASFVASLAFGWLYERSRSLWPSILCHYVFNLLA